MTAEESGSVSPSAGLLSTWGVSLVPFRSPEASADPAERRGAGSELSRRKLTPAPQASF